MFPASPVATFLMRAYPEYMPVPISPLKLVRLTRGYRQFVVAHAAGISSTTLSHIENYHREAQPDVVKRIAAVLGVSPGSLRTDADRTCRKR